MPDNDRKRTRRRFTDEFKRDAAALVLDTGRSIAEVARELDVYEPSLGRWVAQERANRGDSGELSSDERARLRELEREVADLRMADAHLQAVQIEASARRPKGYGFTV